MYKAILLKVEINVKLILKKHLGNYLIIDVNPKNKVMVLVLKR